MTVIENVFIIESPISMIEGERVQFCVEWLGASKLSNPVMAVYQNGKDISSSVLLGYDDFEISGTVLTLRKITAGINDGGTEYVVLIQCNVDVNIERRKLLIEIVKANMLSN
jgi:hypothetical protein